MTALLVIIYIAFISLGLPDSILGSVWPRMQVDLGADLALAGYISMVVTGGTILSSLCCDWSVRKLGTGKVTVLSVALTAASLLGFSLAPSVPWLFFWALPMGLGAGSIDSALNNFVALHYEAKHMSWLHCFWGIGASSGPVIVSLVLRAGGQWRTGYGLISGIQVFLLILLFLSLGLWKKAPNGIPKTDASHHTGGMKLLLHTNGIWPVLFAFILYSACESTGGLWGTTFVHQKFQLAPADAAMASTLFYFGITFGRYLSGFGAKRWDDRTMIRIGLIGALCGLAILLLAPWAWMALAGIAVLGIGFAPIFPSMLHITPKRFGPERSQSIIGLQMAFAYIGSTIMPSLFGILANRFGAWLYPWYQLLMVLALVLFSEVSNRQSK